MSESVGVLGASGYVGSAVVSTLETEAYDVYPAAGSSHETYPTVDLRDREAIRSFVDDVGCVVNTAGLVGVNACEADPEAAFEINAIGATNVAWACARRGVPLVHLSSVATIGDPERQPITAEHPRDPTTTYGRTKLIGDRAVRTATDGRTPSITYCLTNPYGTPPDRAVAGNSVVDFFLERAIAGESLPVHRPGIQERDLIHVTDAAAAVVAAVDAVIDPDASPDARQYVLGSGDAYSILEVAGLVAAACHETIGSSPDVELRERPTPDQPVIRRFDIDTRELEATLGVEPTTTLEGWVDEELRHRLDERERGRNAAHSR
ncbi:NAD-dependent epimerase/dehydratase family protein [Natrarchaeobaculum sulfurireducens]|uniref:Nucleoside-diphosphate-sugar epimerase n=1 Tax=Natrarchaeobaculum sulfurireducens TaxID=2044521 RepID=A0A346PJ34_9EURY|nr:NAD(P)-dependent oxidoreductase [Natrarchaeobaculum sulfurireducens]AXR79529.1 Nucleoside-diphosphate-sugar epimerase [Natrarchaeobaculum sulfurireducens]AXR83302.1 UDP-glucose 4-epimerase [Natrarchaeobaculum sulfurireducens]